MPAQCRLGMDLRPHANVETPAQRSPQRERHRMRNNDCPVWQQMQGQQPLPRICTAQTPGIACKCDDRGSETARQPVDIGCTDPRMKINVSDSQPRKASSPIRTSTAQDSNSTIRRFFEERNADDIEFRARLERHRKTSANGANPSTVNCNEMQTLRTNCTVQ
jgi:hypothetical protein